MEEIFSPATSAWFRASFAAPTAAQTAGWKAIAQGSHTLIHAPTGSGKTLAAFLWVLDRLLHEPAPPKARRCRALYISPMKALAYDVDRNLRAPLAGIRHAALRLGQPELRELSTFLRTGDTPAAARQSMLRHPPDILITTPESLFLLLTSEARKVLQSVDFVVVDEIHAVAGTKRGAHLAISLERLEEITDSSPQRIGLSATQKPLETIAEFLGGGTVEDDLYRPRQVVVADAPAHRPLDLRVVVPVEDMTEPAGPDPDPLDPDVKRIPSIWPAVYPEILEEIDKHRSTIVFANSRRLAERICGQLNELAGSELARAHHGSVSREQRVLIEESLKRGELKAVVATSSLELGIDMGAVDLVIQVEAPVSVASGLQRVGRSGHQVGGESRARIFPKYRGDLLVATVVGQQMLEGNIEVTTIPRNPLDVLAQQLVAMVAIEPRDAAELFAIVRRARPYRELTRDVFEATLDMLAGRYPSDLLAELRPRVNWDRIEGTVSARPGARQLAVANAGTIPDRGLFRVVLPDGGRVGELDEEMVYESRVGDVFVLGATTWRITDIGPERVQVVPAPAAPAARVPFWKGDAPGRPIATGREIGRFLVELQRQPDQSGWLQSEYHLDEFAAQNLAAYINDEIEATGVIPTDQTLVVERFRDEIGDWRVVLLSPLGAKIHAPWAMALTQKLRSVYGKDVDVVWADDGIAFRFPDADEVPGLANLDLEPDEVRPLLEEHLADTALFAARFREAAGRALLLPRRRPGSRSPLWQQRRRAADLLSVARQFGSFPIMLETYREILTEDFDLPGLNEVLADIRSRKIHLVEVETTSASPFASSLLFAFVAAFLYEADIPAAERKASALTLDRDLLAKLLGEGDLRELISLDVLAMVEVELQHLTPERRAKASDDVHDLLRDLGPLTRADLEVRCDVVSFPDTIDQLLAERRIVEVLVAGRECLAAVEDVSRLRDGLGVPPPRAVATAFLQPVADPLADLIGRYARTHGPFQAATVAAALGLPVEIVSAVLQRLIDQGRVSLGGFGVGKYVDVEVLRRVKRRSLAVLREQIEPVEKKSLIRFASAWQGITTPSPRGLDALAVAVGRLQGYEVAASVLERDVLGQRCSEPGPMLDRLMLEGELVWVGRGSLGARDGKVALFRRTQLGAMCPPIPLGFELSPPQEALLNALEQRGAAFFYDLYEAAGGGDPDAVLESLWDLVWAGQVSNDTLAPLRAYVGFRSGRRQAGRRPLGSSFPPHAAGRWSRLRLDPPDPTRFSTAWAAQLLDRYGLVTRAHVAAESIPGGWTSLYPVLVRMEEVGKIRRGYFVEGLGGAQFALPGAVDRLRSAGADELRGLAATDPANPFGTVLAWPESPVRLQRVAGAYVILGREQLHAYLDRGGRRLYLFAPPAPEVARELANIAARRRRLLIEEIDDMPAARSPLGAALTEWGFVPALRGFAFRKS